MDTVTLACKLPHGMHLENIGPNGMVEERVTIKGARLKTTPAGKEITKGHETTDDFGKSYGLTPNVPAKFWEKWVEQNPTYPPYVRGMIFAQSDLNEARAQAAEMSEIVTGFEALPQDKLPRGLEKFDPDKA
jgi:hypothetical protein